MSSKKAAKKKKKGADRGDPMEEEESTSSAATGAATGDQTSSGGGARSLEAKLRALEADLDLAASSAPRPAPPGSAAASGESSTAAARAAAEDAADSLRSLLAKLGGPGADAALGGLGLGGGGLGLGGGSAGRAAARQAANQAQQLLQGLKTGDETQQLTSLMELCELLSMATEDSLLGSGAFPVDQLAPALVQLLQCEHNPELVLYAARAVAYLLEALPGSAAQLVAARVVERLCGLLMSVQDIDVAEQALSCLEKIVQEPVHARHVLMEGGLTAVLAFVDFFSIAAQRVALSVAAAVCRSVPPEQWQLVADAASLLAPMLGRDDPRLVEKALLALSRLADCARRDPAKLAPLTHHGIAGHLMRILAAGPGSSAAVAGSSSYTLAVRLLAELCAGCPLLLVPDLLRDGLAVTLHGVLAASGPAQQQQQSSPPATFHDGNEPQQQQATPSMMMVSSISVEQQSELLGLVQQLLPPLPPRLALGLPSTATAAVPVVPTLMRASSSSSAGARAALAAAAAAAAAAASTSSGSSAGTASRARAKRGGSKSSSAVPAEDEEPEEAADGSGDVLFELPAATTTSSSSAAPAATSDQQQQQHQQLPQDPRVELYEKHPDLLYGLAERLLGALIGQYTASVNTVIRHRALCAVLQLIHAASAPALLELLRTEPVSSFIATLLASPERPIVATGLKLASDLLSKLPHIFERYFRREGVVFELARLSSSSSSSSLSSPPAAAASGAGPASQQPPAPSPSAAAAAAAQQQQQLDAAWVAAEAQRLQATYFSSSSSSGAAGTVEQQQEDALATEQLRAARALAAELTGRTKSSRAVAPRTIVESDAAVLGELRALLSSAEGLSAFELLQSGLVPALLHYLTSAPSSLSPPAAAAPAAAAAAAADAADKAGLDAAARDAVLEARAAVFGSVFLQTPDGPDDAGPQPLSLLLRQLHEALAKSERLPVALGSEHLASGPAAGLKYLTQPFKLRLTPDPARSSAGVTMPGGGELVVLIEPLASVQAVIDFLRPRLKLVAVPAAASAADSPAAAQQQPQQPKPTAAEPPAAQQQQSRPRRSGRKQQRAAEETTGGDASAATEEDDEHEADEARVAVEDEQEHDGHHADEIREHDDDEDAEEAYAEEEAEADALDRSATVDEVTLSPPPAAADGTAAPGAAAPAVPVTTPSAAAASRSSPVPAAAAGDHEHPQLDLALYIDGQRLSPTSSVFQALQAAASRRRRGDQQQQQQQQQQTAAEPGGGVEAAPPMPIHRLWDSGAHTVHIGITLRQGTSDSAAQAVAEDEMEVDSAGSGPRSTPAAQSLGLLRSPYARAVQWRFAGSLDPSAVTDVAQQILALLTALYELNDLWGRHLRFELEDLKGITRTAQLAGPGVKPQPQQRPLVGPGEFISPKLAAKLTRQLQDALTVSSGALPTWCRQLSVECGFLLPFEARRLLFYATSFGLARALQTLQQMHHSAGGGGSNGATRSDELRLGRIQRQKVRIARQRLLESAMKVMDLYGRSRAVLETEFFGEVGTGLGPTLEFYTLASRELMRRDLDLWRDAGPLSTSSDTEQQLVRPPGDGLFPRAVRKADAQRLERFRFAGTFVAKALLDSRLLDLPLSPPFLKLLLGVPLDLQRDLAAVDPGLAASLARLAYFCRRRQRILADLSLSDSERRSAVDALRLDGGRVEDLELDFTLPGDPDHELKVNGAMTPVTAANLEQYVELVAAWHLVDGVRACVDAFRSGFEGVFPVQRLAVFDAAELASLLGGAQPHAWSKDMLLENTTCGKGYTQASGPVQALLEVLTELTPDEQREFLLFITGSPRLPPGGFKALDPKLTIVKSEVPKGHDPDSYLPSVNCCFLYLKLPEYSSKAVLRQKLFYSVRQGQGHFSFN